ncbi:MAG TPA: protease modulator HflK [Xanthobacteraceae bacterium]|jgi:membrane protease subunit HflK|nr:protease modulator HflK [Xanthobacteraceae bacterium]
MPWSNQTGGGGPWGSGSRGPWGSGPQQPGGPKPPDLEEFLRRSQDRLRDWVPGNLGGRGIAVLVLAAVVLWGLSGFFRVEPDEIGAVLRFGKFVREVQPGLNYHLPYPIETALTPQALRVNKVDIGFDQRRSGSLRDVEEESLMLTGDQNIVDVEFSVFWRVKPNSVGDYLFNVANPASTVKAVAESAMRQVIGHSDAQPLLAGFQQTGAASTTGPGGTTTGGQAVVSSVDTATQVQDLMQKTLDSYNAGILVQSVQLQTIQVPAKVIDSFRDVQAASQDLVRAQNEAQTYANRVVPEARGRAAKITQDAEAYRSQTVADATGQASRFTQIYQQYKNAPDLTRQRIYLETMEQILGSTDKTIIDTGAPGSSSVLPFLPLGSPAPQRPAQQQSGGNP